MFEPGMRVEFILSISEAERPRIGTICNIDGAWLTIREDITQVTVYAWARYVRPLNILERMTHALDG